MFRTRNIGAKKLLAAILMVGATASANATVMTLSGTTVNYTFDDSLLGLFGSASISGDTLYFTPTNFKATSANGAGSITTSQNLAVQITLKSGYQFLGFDLLERGDYLLYGPGTNTANVGGTLGITDGTNTLSMPTSPSAPLNISGLPTHNWDETLNASLLGWSSSLDLSLTSDLAASSSQAQGIGFVEQKYAGITVTTSAVPEGNSLVTLMVGLGVLSLHLTRKKQKQTL